MGKTHETEINQRRTNLANGLKFDQGTKSFSQVADECLSKLVRHAEVVRVFDYALGKYYSNDQPVNLKRLVSFLGDHTSGLTEMEIHTLSDERISLERDVADLQNEVDFKIKLVFKERESDLPHPRYFGTDGPFLDIDRSIDLCDAHHLCRLTQIKYAGSPT